jgi:hypothetical protein
MASSKTKPVLMHGYSQKQLMHNPARARERRWDYPRLMCQWLLEDTARRVEASKKLFGEKFFRGDCHSHTQHSDGIGTVAETAEMVKAAGFDFQFVTDHWGLTQAPECREHGLWYGQEPVTKDHHMLILGLENAFTPQMDFLQDMEDARALGATVCVPHPTGWWPTTIYTKAQTDLLEKLPDPFLMEICNGANNIVRAIDYTDDAAARLWDHLLGSGKIVHAMGNTDAHAPHSIGMVWNGVFALRCSKTAILKTLREGHHFVSEAPLVNLRAGGVSMGGFVKKSKTLKLQLNAVDSRGLSKVLLIADGKVIKQWNPENNPQLKLSMPFPPRATKYVRMEAIAADAKHAWSNPIFIK